MFRYKNKDRVVGMVFVDAVNPNNTMYQDDETYVPTPFPLTIWKLACEFGFTKLVNLYGFFDWNLMNYLPQESRDPFLRSYPYQCKLPYVLSNELNNLGRIASQVLKTGKVGDLPIVVINAVRGFNNTGLSFISENSKIINLDVDHYVPYYKNESLIIAKEAISLIKK